MSTFAAKFARFSETARQTNHDRTNSHVELILSCEESTVSARSSCIRPVVPISCDSAGSVRRMRNLFKVFLCIKNILCIQLKTDRIIIMNLQVTLNFVIFNQSK